jgi:D-alanine-D-alanine ligase
VRITILTFLTKKGDASSYDVVVPQVAEALRMGGHEPAVVGFHDDLEAMIADIRRSRPEVVFNLAETFSDLPFLGDVGVVGVLELLGVPYTGGGPGEFYIGDDKGLAKKLLAFDGILYPDFAVFSEDNDLETGGKLRMPLFVKPLRNDASIGISADSLVKSTRDMLERIVEIHRTLQDSALVEEYIEGREFYVGILGNRDPVAFPPIEMDFSGLPEGAPHVLDARAKWEKDSAEYQGTRPVFSELTDELTAKLQKVSLDAYRALRVRDYGRVDLRLTDTNEIYVIEVNASCYLEKHSELASAAAAAGLDYTTLVNRIVELALERRRLPAPGELIAPRRNRGRRGSSRERG